MIMIWKIQIRVRFLYKFGGTKMKRFMAGIASIDKSLYVIAGSVLACMIILTLCDVILRNFGHPITGSMEFIQYGGCIVFGFAIPYGTMLGAQVIVDIVTEKLSPGKKRIIEIITRCIGILIFLFIAYNFYVYGMDVREQVSVRPVLRYPITHLPLPFHSAFSCRALTIFCDLIKKVKGADNE